jgi:hypothetical protein
VDNVKINPGEIHRDDMGWIDLAQYGDKWRNLVNTVMNLQVP